MQGNIKSEENKVDLQSILIVLQGKPTTYIQPTCAEKTPLIHGSMNYVIHCSGGKAPSLRHFETTAKQSKQTNNHRKKFNTGDT